MTLLGQIAAVTLLSLMGLPHRLRSSLVMIAGVAGAVAAVLSLMALSSGLRSMALGNVDPNLALVLSSGASAEYNSDLSPSDVALIAQAPDIRRDAAGRPMVQAQAMILVNVVRKKGGVTDSIYMRGTGVQGLAMFRHLHLISGRMYRPGSNELIVGTKAEAEYTGLEPGARVSLRGIEWNVVGIFEEGGGIGEMDLLTDANTEISAFARTDYQSVLAELDKPSEFRQFSDALTSNPQLSVVARPYRDFLAVAVRQLTGVLNFVTYLVGAVMAVGAVFAAVNTLYSAVDARRREIATLRAIGFSGLAVLLSVVGEAVTLALPGGFLGAGIAWLIFSGRQAAVSGFPFDLVVTPQLFVVGLASSLTFGLAGAIFPAIRAAMLPVATALRAT